MTHDTGTAPSGKPSKPEKPYEDFPLFAHATGRWARKIHGKFHYFGKWNDWQSALAKYQRERDDLYAGRKPRDPSAPEHLTLKDLSNEFLNSKRHLLDTRDIRQRTFNEYEAACVRLCEILGKDRLVSDLQPSDFDSLRAELAKTRGPVTLGNEVQRIRVAFKFGVDTGLIERAVRYGQNFKRPSKRIVRQARAKLGTKMMQPADLRKVIAAAPVQMRAMIYLGLNCGFGNNDCGTLAIAAVDLKKGWVDFPRPKTGIPRRAPLWPETKAALKTVLDARRKAKHPQDDGLVFLTRCGTSWAKDGMANPISAEFRKLLVELKLHRKGIGFYALRHIFQTVGKETKDTAAVSSIMGHELGTMEDVYSEGVSDRRLRDVTNRVRKWLLGK